jgi:hypothetical protein
MNDTRILKLRAHHICCSPYLSRRSERGSGFPKIRSKIEKALSSEPDSIIMVIEGVDELCKACPLCKEDLCESPDGNEEKVRKWDSILLNELGISFNTAMKVSEWQSLTEEKWPFQICQKCKWRLTCRVSSLDVNK